MSPQRSILMFLLGLQLSLVLHTNLSLVQCTHITGTFNTDEFFRFLMKFGFQQTDRHHQRDSYGYIFGNVTSRNNFSQPITLAVLDRGHFLEYYGNRTVKDRSEACARMFNTLNQSSYDARCNIDGQDFLRYRRMFSYS